MRTRTKILGLFLALTLIWGSFPLALAADDAIVAVVNDQIITLRELHDYLNAVYFQLTSEGRSPEEIEKIMLDYEINGLDQLIDDKLLVDEANRKGLEIRPKAIEERISAVKSKYPTEQEFLDALASDGLTLTDLRNKITDQYKAKYIVEMEVRRKIYVNPQEVTDYYREHAQEFQEPERVELDSIFVASGEDPGRSRLRAEEALKRLKEGLSFEEAVKEFSEGPSIGVVKKGQVLPSLEEVIFPLKEGETSSVVEVEGGFYIFRVKKKIPTEGKTLPEAKADIYNRLFERKFRQTLKSWMENLRKNAYVEIKT